MISYYYVFENRKFRFATIDDKKLILHWLRLDTRSPELRECPRIFVFMTIR
jgi:hypothetical protein